MENDEVLTLEGSRVLSKPDFEHRRDTRPAEVFEKDVGGGTKRQNTRFTVWVEHLNKQLDGIARIEILSLAPTQMYNGKWRDPGDAKIKMWLLGECRSGRQELESTPSPNDVYRIKRMTCQKSDETNRTQLLIHPALDGHMLWRIITPDECRIWLKQNEFVTNDQWFRGKKTNQMAPLVGQKKKNIQFYFRTNLYG